MKSVKPGRGPSMMGGIMSIAVGAFGVIWIIVAAGMGGSFCPYCGTKAESGYEFCNKCGRKLP